MKIEQGTTKGKQSIVVIAESKNIIEFIHIRDRNSKYLGMLTIVNRHSGKTKVEYDDHTGDSK